MTKIKLASKYLEIINDFPAGDSYDLLLKLLNDTDFKQVILILLLKNRY